MRHFCQMKAKDCWIRNKYVLLTVLCKYLVPISGSREIFSWHTLPEVADFLTVVQVCEVAGVMSCLVILELLVVPPIRHFCHPLEKVVVDFVDVQGFQGRRDALEHFDGCGDFRGEC